MNVILVATEPLIGLSYMVKIAHTKIFDLISIYSGHFIH